jgi:hypothetical protein
MRRSNFALRLQPSLLAELRKAAEVEGVALNQLINVAWRRRFLPYGRRSTSKREGGGTIAGKPCGSSNGLEREMLLLQAMSFQTSGGRNRDVVGEKRPAGAARGKGLLS